MSTIQAHQPRILPTVLYQDEHCLVVDKPAGMLVHRGMDNDTWTLIDAVRVLTGQPTVFPIHRLDRPTSGAVLFALDSESARILGDLREQHLLDKRYLAFVRGQSPLRGIVDAPVPKDEGGSKVPATSFLSTLSTQTTQPRSCSLVLISPITGRFHQLRRHLKHINHMILGDTTYGKSDLNRAFAQNYGLTRLGLHAYALSLPVPWQENRIHVVAPLANDLQQAALRMGFVEDDWQKSHTVSLQFSKDDDGVLYFP